MQNPDEDSFLYISYSEKNSLGINKLHSEVFSLNVLRVTPSWLSKNKIDFLNRSPLIDDYIS